MLKYHFNVKINRVDNNAGSKATQDCKTILLDNGFNDLEISFIKVWYLMPFNLVKLILLLCYYLLNIRSKSLLLVQYPLQGINPYFKYFIKLLKLKGCVVSCIIHDLDSLRADFNQTNLDKEIDALLAYDAIISHNTAMTEWLRENGYKGFVTEVLLFDYLVEKPVKKDVTKNNEEARRIAYAGNLARGNFLKNLSKVNGKFRINLYGSGLDKKVLDNNKNIDIKWYGSFSPTEIVNEINGDFGLVWDGDSVEDIKGLMGGYLKYNTPHKTSLYLTAGLPVIVSKKAAIAEFIKANNIGICINGITEISDRIDNLEREMYMEMKENVRLFSEKLESGYFMTQAVHRIENFFAQKNSAL